MKILPSIHRKIWKGQKNFFSSINFIQADDYLMYILHLSKFSVFSSLATRLKIIIASISDFDTIQVIGFFVLPMK